MKAKILFALLAIALLVAAGTAFYLNSDSLPPVPPTAAAPTPAQVRDDRTFEFPRRAIGSSFSTDSSSVPPESAPVSTESSDAPPPETAAVPATRRVFQKPIRQPLIFQDFDEQTTGLSETQTRMLHALREDFVREVGGPQQDPSDPAYVERWRQLQARYDEKLSAFFGSEFVEQLARLAAQPKNEAASRH